MDKSGMTRVMKWTGRLLTTAALLTLSPALYSCDNDEARDVVKKKVVIAYLASDNDLSVSGYRKVRQLESGYEGSEGTTLYIFHDPADRPPYIITLTPEGKTTKELEETDSADAGLLGKLCTDISSANPGASFGLVLFSHSTGWLPHGAFEVPTRSMAVDGTRGMELGELATALPDGMFDYIILESCYSAGIEVAFALRGKAAYIAVSSAEILDPGFTYVYGKYLYSLYSFDGPPVKFMREAFGEFENSSGLMQSATFSIIDTGKTADLVQFLRQYAVYTPVMPDEGWQYFDRNVAGEKSIRLVYDFTCFYSHGLDSKAAGELEALVDMCVVYKASTREFLRNDSRHDGFEIARHSGLTTFVPQEGIPHLNEAYRQTAWYKAVFE